MRTRGGAAALLGLILAAAGALAPTALAAGGNHGADVSAAVRHDTSPPLRSMHTASPSARNLTERPIHRLNAGQGNGPDSAQQSDIAAAPSTSGGVSIQGLGQGAYGMTDHYAPPDTVGAVGATQYVQWVNDQLAVFNKTTGAIVLGPVSANTIWSGFGGGCQTNNDGDPIVNYDKISNRWVLTQFSVSTTPYLQCVAVSTTSDATGSYYRYAFSYGNTQFPDYPKLSVWPDAYYITFNIFNNGQTFAGSKLCAYNRSAMLTGAAATQQCFQLSTAYGGVLPADLDGSTLPPSGEPGMFMNFGTNALNFWRLHVDWNNTANTTLTGPASIPVASFSAACNGGGTCIPQPGTSEKLDSLGDRLMYRLAYRNFGDHEALVVNHSVTASSITSVRWYELRNAPGQTMASATPVVYQQSTLNSADGTHRWMGSIAMDKAGDIALGYSASSTSVYPSVRMTGRLSTDALNTMQTETTLKAGTGSQTQNLSRWGDYSAMTVDPTDDCTFWYTNEYIKSNGTFNWSTWIQSFSFPECTGGGGGPTTGTLSGTVTDSATHAAIAGASVTVQGGPTTTTDPSGNYSFTLTGGPYNVSASASGYTTSAPANVTVTNGATTDQDFALVSSGPAPTVPGTPSAPTLSTGSGRGIQVRWTTPSNGGSPITGYTLHRYTATASSCNTASVNKTIPVGNVLSYKDTSTTRNSYYCYSVAAVNAVGTGNYSAIAGPIRSK